MPSHRFLRLLALALALSAAAPATASQSLNVDVALPAGARAAHVTIAGDTIARGRRAQLAAAISEHGECPARPPRMAKFASAAIRNREYRRTLRLFASGHARRALAEGDGRACAWQTSSRSRPLRVLAAGEASLHGRGGLVVWRPWVIAAALALLIARWALCRRRARRRPVRAPPWPSSPASLSTPAGDSVEELAVRSARGHNAERVVSERLRALVDEGWELFEGFFPDGARGDVDHYLRGPAAAWAIETKSYARIRQSDLLQAARAADAVAALEQRHVHAVLCLAAGPRTHLEGRRQAAGRDVFVVSVETIASKLRAWDAGCATRSSAPVETEIPGAAAAAPAPPVERPAAAALEPSARPAGPLAFAVEATLDFESLQLGDYRLN